MSQDQRNRDKKRRVDDANQAARPVPKPEWANAFMIMALYRIACLEAIVHGGMNSAPDGPGKLTMSFDDLKRFEALEGDNKTSLKYDDIKRTVTITAPEMIMPDKKILVPDKRVISN